MSEARPSLNPNELGELPTDLYSMFYNRPERSSQLPDQISSSFHRPLEVIKTHIRNDQTERSLSFQSVGEPAHLTFLRKLEALDDEVVEFFSQAGERSNNLFLNYELEYNQSCHLASELASLINEEYVVVRRVLSASKVRHVYDILNKSFAFAQLKFHPLVRKAFLNLNSLAHIIGITPPDRKPDDSLNIIEQWSDEGEDEGGVSPSA